MPPVSVIIPCYNAAPFIAATLQSVLEQDVDVLEVIVVDDGSTDGSAELVERDFPDVRVVRQRNGGVAAARNSGLRQACHGWVAFVDADDIWLPGKLRAQWAALAAMPEARMAYTAWQVWTNDAPEPEAGWLADLQSVAGNVARWQGAHGWIYPELLIDCVVWTSTVLAERALLQEVGGFDEALRIGEDWDLWLRLSRLTPIVRVPRPFALYRMHPASITKSPPAVNYKHVIVHRALERWGLRGPDGRSARMVDVRRSQARTWRDLAGARLKSGDARRARHAAVQALRRELGSLHGWLLFVKSIVGSLVYAAGHRGG